MTKTLVALLGLLLVVGSPIACEESEESQMHSIGTATMRGDGTVVLTLVAITGSATGHAQFEYEPDDPDYAKIVAHIGGIREGEVKPVPPWPDQE